MPLVLAQFILQIRSTHGNKQIPLSLIEKEQRDIYCIVDRLGGDDED